MKGTLIKKFGNIDFVLILAIGTLSTVGFFSGTVNAEAVDGAQVIAADGEVSFDENEDGWIDADGNNDIGIEWTVDYAPATTYVRVISGLKVTTESFYDEGNCIRMVRWCNDVVKNYFGKHNKIQIWYGNKRQGYSEVKIDLPRKVENFPIDFYLKSSVNIDYLNSIAESVASTNNKAYTYSYSENNDKKVVEINFVIESENINTVETYDHTSSYNRIRSAIFSRYNFLERIFQLRVI